jgi:hypothetical protein
VARTISAAGAHIDQDALVDHLTDKITEATHDDDHDLVRWTVGAVVLPVVWEEAANHRLAARGIVPVKGLVELPDEQWSDLYEQRYGSFFGVHENVETTPPPAAPDPEVAAWARRQADLIARRLDDLVVDVEVIGPAWAATVAPPPDDPAGAARWRAAVRRIVAYRDTYEAPDDAPLPAKGPGRGVQGRAYDDAADALATLPRVEEAPPDPARDEHAAAVRRARTAERIQAALDNTDRPSARTVAERLVDLRERRETEERTDDVATRLRDLDLEPERQEDALPPVTEHGPEMI